MAKPPDIEWVFLHGGETGELATYQHPSAIIAICRDGPAARCRPQAPELRSFRVAGRRYVVVSVSPLWSVRPVILEYWRTVRFLDHRPSWLTMDLYPGGLYAEHE